MLLTLLPVVGCGPFSQRELAALRQLHSQPPPASPSNRFADDSAAALLGQQLFFDARLSGPLALPSDLGAAGAEGKVACATCHDPARGGADRRSKPGNTSLAAGFTGRNAPTVYNVACVDPWMFWDGRADSVWSQALGPLESPVEHNYTRLEAVHLVADLPGYRAAYEAIFGALPELSDRARFPSRGKPGEPAFDAMSPADQLAINRAFSNLGKAIEAYERRLLSANSAFDRFLDGDAQAMTYSAQRGAQLFVGKAACTECHFDANLADCRFHNTGVAQAGPNVPDEDPGRAAGVARVRADLFNQSGPFSDYPSDAHLLSISGEAMEGAFKTPTLRNVSQTAPYMHTGSLATLEDVVLFYRRGGHRSGYSGRQDAAMQRLNLTDEDVADLVEFLKALDGAPLPVELVTAPPLP